MTTTELAELIKDELNDTTFSQAFTAIRVAMPLFKLSDMGTLHVTVVPRELAVSLGSRRDNSYEMGVDVAVQQRLANVNNATVDALVTLAQEIVDHMTRLKMSTAHWRATGIEPLYAPGHLRELRQFTCVINLTYEEQRAC